MLNFDLFNSFLSWRMKKRFHQIDLFVRYPIEVQQEVLMKLIQAAAQTEYGRRYDFDSIRSYDRFRERVPIVDYEFLEHYVERLRNGEQQLLWPSEIKWFAKSSGTTSSKSKFIPVSREALEDCHFKGGKDMISIYCSNNPETRIFTGKSLRLGGSTKINSDQNDSYYGDLSAIIIENLPFWANMMSTPSNRISLMDEWESKIEAIAAATVREDVTSMAGVPSWMLVLASKMLELRGVTTLTEVWPNLEAYFHGGVAFGPYRDQFSRLIPKTDFNYYQTYNASEGFFGIQDQNGSEDMLLMLDYGIFYEFEPLNAPMGRAIPLEEVELHVPYALIITTNAGLWRYRIGDTLMFTSTQPYRIALTGRTKHYINVFGEELAVDNAEKAIERSCRKTGASVSDFTAGPIYMKQGQSGGHEWIVEFTQPPPDLAEFAHWLDVHLKELNSDYEAKRHKDMALQPPLIHVAPPGTFHRWMRERGKLGGQNKVPRLANDRQYLEQILPLLRDGI